MADTALHAHLAARGATMADDRGIVLPRRFGDVAAEYAALRTGAALADGGFRTIVRACGPDRRRGASHDHTRGARDDTAPG